MSYGPVAKVHQICKANPDKSRKELKDLCIAEGINPATAATQIQAYRKKYGLSNTKPKAERVIESEAKLNEKEWADSIGERIQDDLNDKFIKVVSSSKLFYANEIWGYPCNENFELLINDDLIFERKLYETDLLIYEIIARNGKGIIIPRVIIETKLRKVTTHDAITYSQKALSHKTIHPYLRYGILIGNKKNGKMQELLYRHGLHFDFMVSLNEASEKAFWGNFIEIIKKEITASKDLQKILYKEGKERYSIVHHELKLY